MATLARCVRSAPVPALSVIYRRLVRGPGSGSYGSEAGESGVKERVSTKPNSRTSVAELTGARGTGETRRDVMIPMTFAQSDMTRYLTSTTRVKQAEGVWYERVPRGDKRVSRLAALARSKKLREQQGKVLLYGQVLISDAVTSGAKPHTIFFSSVERLKELPLHKLTQSNLIRVHPEELTIWPDVKPPPDLIAVFRHTDLSQMLSSEKRSVEALPLTLICDNLRDPGNMGTTLRSAAAAGCHTVLLTKGCVDVWEHKVLQGALGAHFHLPIIPGLTWADVQARLPGNAMLHVADNCGDGAEEPVSPRQPHKAGHYGWVSGRCPSKMHLEDGGVSDNDDDDEYAGQEDPVLEAQPYHASWIGGHTALVIGGETHGISREALQLAVRTGGRKLLIPMVRGVDSLNSAMAASVLLFEARRQLTLGTEQMKTHC